MVCETVNIECITKTIKTLQQMPSESSQGVGRSISAHNPLTPGYLFVAPHLQDLQFHVLPCCV